MVLLCISLMICDIEYIFLCLQTIGMSFLEKCLFKPFVHFLIRFFALLVLSCMSSLILGINHLSDISLANMFSHSMDCLFIVLMVSFPVQKLLV